MTATVDAAERGAAWLLARLRPFVDGEVRKRQLAMVLEREPERAARAAGELVARAAAGEREAEVTAAVGCLTHAIAMLGYPARRALHEAAVAQGATTIARLVIDVSPPTADPAEVSRQLKPERPLRGRGRPLTLGERKAMARRPRGEALAALIKDPHPDVVGNLLDNPQLTEREVIAIAASRPAVPEALARVAAHPRWSARASVRRALALNPHTPVHVAVRLAVTLGVRDWGDIAGASELAPALREQARSLLAARGKR